MASPSMAMLHHTRSMALFFASLVTSCSSRWKLRWLIQSSQSWEALNFGMLLAEVAIVVGLDGVGVNHVVGGAVAVASTNSPRATVPLLQG